MRGVSARVAELATIFQLGNQYFQSKSEGKTRLRCVHVAVQQSDRAIISKLEKERPRLRVRGVFFSLKELRISCRPANELFCFWKEREEQMSSSDVCFVLSSARVVDRAPLLLLSSKVLPKEL